MLYLDAANQLQHGPRGSGRIPAQPMKRGDQPPLARALRTCLRSAQEQGQESQVNELQTGVEQALTVLG
jgi:hypothetical protein